MRAVFSLLMVAALSGAPAHAQDEPAGLSADEVAELAATTTPRTSRAGHLRISTPALEVPEAAPHLLERLEGDESPAVRAAVAEALPRTGGEWSAELAAMLPDESSALVRRAMVSALRYGEAGYALPALESALSDEHQDVRAAAALVIGQRADGDALADALIDAASDEWPQVRAQAVRSLYWRRVDAWDAMTPLLGDVDAEVRFQTLYAMKKLDPERAAALTALPTLRQDVDPRVARIAGQLGAE